MRVLMVTSEWPSEELPAAGSFIAQQVDFLRAAGVEVEVFAFRGAKNPLRYASVRRRLRALFKQNTYDLVHAQFGQSGVVVFPTIAPLVVTFHGGGDLHGFPYEGPALRVLGWCLRAASRFVARRADEVIVQSQDLASRLPSGVGYTVIPCGVDLDLFKPEAKASARSAIGLADGERLILFSGDPRIGFKRFALAEQAVELVKRHHPVRLITLSGLPRSEVARHMNASDVLLVTSAYEAGPVMVKEALACNLPVVGVAVGDVPERIGQLEGCALCSDDRPETIAAGIIRVLERRGGFDGRTSVDDVDERLLVERLVAIYERALDKG